MLKWRTSLKMMSFILSAVLLACLLPFSAMAESGVIAELDPSLFPADTYLVDKKEYIIAPGVYETHFTANNGAGTRQNQCYALTVDINSQATLIASYKNQDGTKDGMQTVRDQACAAEKVRGVNVVAGVNADIYNMQTGAPFGYLIMDGVEYYHNTMNNPYFAILKDGTAAIREAGEPCDDVKEAVGLWCIFVRDGKNITQKIGTYDTSDQPRTAIGIKADGSVVIIVNDGRLSPVSSGFSWSETADLLISMGCVIAGNLDGGGSSTLISQHEGSNELLCRNMPCNGSERNVSTALLVVSRYEEDNVFDHAAIQSDKDIYEPGSEVVFSVAGADVSGAKAPLPKDGYFALEDSSFGSIDKNGVFRSNGKTGQVTVLYRSDSEIYGSHSITVQKPDVQSDSYMGFVKDENTGIIRYKYLGQYMKNKWLTVGRDVYYVDAAGVVVTGQYTVTESIVLARDGVEEFLFGGKPTALTYTFDSDGKLVKGAVVNRSGAQYYVYAGVLQYGWHYYDGDWHYFDGVKDTNYYGKLLKGNWSRNSERYVCDSNGALVKGYLFQDEGGTKYIWAGKILTGWQEVNGVAWDNKSVTGTYYFDHNNSCYMATGRTVIDGVVHYFNANGSLREGAYETEEGIRYLVAGVPQTGWIELNGEYFYFDPTQDGILVETADPIARILLVYTIVFDTFAKLIQLLNAAF